MCVYIYIVMLLLEGEEALEAKLGLSLNEVR